MNKSLMESATGLSFLIGSLLMLIAMACAPKVETVKVDLSKVEGEVTKALTKHLNAVSNRDLKTLGATLSPSGAMQLILPKRPISTTADNFLEFHEEWFQDSTWTFETKIVNMDVSEKLALVTVESMYREPERNGKPYFNKMNISYGLQKINDQWFVIKDHASSLEKTEN